MAVDADATTMAILAEIFAAFPGRFRFTSGTRTAAQNAAVGGVEGSYHVRGMAADFVAINGSYPSSDLERIGEIVARHGYEVIKHNAGSGLHYHIEPAPGYSPANYTGGGSNDDDTQDTGNGSESSNIFLYAAIGLLFVVLLTD